MLEKRITAEAHRGRGAARQVDSVKPSAPPEKAAQTAPEPPKKAEKEEA